MWGTSRSSKRHSQRQHNSDQDTEGSAFSFDMSSAENKQAPSISDDTSTTIGSPEPSEDIPALRASSDQSNLLVPISSQHKELEEATISSKHGMSDAQPRRNSHSLLLPYHASQLCHKTNDTIQSNLDVRAPSTKTISTQSVRKRKPLAPPSHIRPPVTEIRTSFTEHRTPIRIGNASNHERQSVTNENTTSISEEIPANYPSQVGEHNENLAMHTNNSKQDKLVQLVTNAFEKLEEMDSNMKTVQTQLHHLLKNSARPNKRRSSGNRRTRAIHTTQNRKIKHPSKKNHKNPSSGINRESDNINYFSSSSNSSSEDGTDTSNTSSSSKHSSRTNDDVLNAIQRLNTKQTWTSWASNGRRSPGGRQSRQPAHRGASDRNVRLNHGGVGECKRNSFSMSNRPRSRLTMDGTNRTARPTHADAESLHDQNDSFESLLPIYQQYDGRFSMDELTSLLQRFRKMDVNGDGKLNAGEITNVILADQNMQRFRKIDSANYNNNGGKQILLPEMKKSATVDKEDDIDPELFNRADVENDVKKLLQHADSTGDDEIDFLELLSLLESFENGDNKMSGIASAFVKHAHGVRDTERDTEHDIRFQLVIDKSSERMHQKNQVGSGKYLINPTGLFHVSWDLMVSIILLSTVITIPLVMGFESVEESLVSYIAWTDIVFILDIIKHFFTGVVNEGETTVIVMNNQYITINYLRTWFFPDLISSLPTDIIVEIIRSVMTTEGKQASIADLASVARSAKMVKLLRLLRLAKFVRLLRMSRFFKHIHDAIVNLESRFGLKFPNWLLSLVLLFTYLMLTAHWLGCISWMAVRMSGYPSDSWAVQGRIVELVSESSMGIWTSSFDANFGLQDNFSTSEPVNYTVIFQSSETQQYSHSVIRALNHLIGERYLDQQCTAIASDWCEIESWLVSIDMYIGSVFLAFTIATLGNIISNLDLAGSAFHAKRVQLEQYITSKGLPPQLRDRVLKHYQVRFSDRKLFDEHELLSVLSEQMQQKVMLYNHRGLIDSVPLLNSKSNRFVMSICRALVLEVFSMGDVVIQEGSVGEDMYFIYSGLVEIVSKYRPASVVAAIGDGCYFGDVAVLLHAPTRGTTIDAQDEEIRYERRSATARAKTLLVLYKLNRAALFESLQDFTTIHEYMFGIAEERRARVRQLQAAHKYIVVTHNDSEDAKTELFASTQRATEEMLLELQRKEDDEREKEQIRIATNGLRGFRLRSSVVLPASVQSTSSLSPRYSSGNKSERCLNGNQYKY